MGGVFIRFPEEEIEALEVSERAAELGFQSGQPLWLPFPSGLCKSVLTWGLGTYAASAKDTGS